uniref:Uncharacterized protein MANES_03G007900 n=1 Tax=Rhizophora mucronata TaxID=61149 RepID=A0A2P2LFK4_RHIMU
MVARQPCMDDIPNLTLSFSPSSENFSVLGELRYIPISSGPDWATVQLQKIRFRCKIIETGSQKAYPLIDNRFPKN